jgi:hypothetical protein
MVPSSAITVAANGESMTCSGFSLSKTIRLGKFKSITDYFGGLSLSPRRGDEGAAFMGSTHERAATPRRAMVEDSTEEFLTLSSGEGSFCLPSPRRRRWRTFQPLRLRGWFPCRRRRHGQKIASPSTDVMLIMGGRRHKLALGSPQLSKGQCHGEGSSPARKPQPRFIRQCRCRVSSRMRQKGSRQWLCLHSGSGQGGRSPCQS